MGGFGAAAAIAASLVIMPPQQGGGGFGGGGMGGVQGGAQLQQLDRSLRRIDIAISEYLSGDEIKSILTPGEYTEWPLKLKEGQVVIAESRSDAFDPALEVVDDKDQVLKNNDDRFPGDQRPLLLWRCPKDGEYKLRGRCFQNKAGGQMHLRLRIYDAMDLGSSETAERKWEKSESVLVRIPMKAGQLCQVANEDLSRQRYGTLSFESTIGPDGLPDLDLGGPFSTMGRYAVMAPVDGDYFVFCRPQVGPGGIAKVRLKRVEPKALARIEDAGSATFQGGDLSVFTVSVKAGEVLEASTPDMHLGLGITVAERPDFSKYDTKKPEMNPFFPKVPKEGEPEEKPAFETLPARARDPRIAVVVAKRDAVLMLASGVFADAAKTYTLRVRPAPRHLSAEEEQAGDLRIGSHDYWSFDAKVGDVMRFRAKSGGFSARLEVRDPNLRVQHVSAFGVDQTTAEWSFIVETPGRYLLSISCVGDGGGGAYGVFRSIVSPKEVRKGAMASGELTPGAVHVWKLAARPDEPLLVRWSSSDWNYGISVRDETGAAAHLPLTVIDSSSRFGILKVDKAKTLMIVLTGFGQKASYEIEPMALPGFGGVASGGK